MEVSSLSQYKNLTKSIANNVKFTHAATIPASVMSSLFKGSFPAPTTPTTAVSCGNSLLGSMAPTWDITGSATILGAFANKTATAGHLILCDRLSHQGGLVGNVATVQTTNLPTAAYGRDVSGEGILAGLEIYTIIGTTGSSGTISYTNSEGTAGRTSKPFRIGGTGFREAGGFILIPLADGDTGVRSVQSVTLGSTTGTAGAFGVTLFKPISWYSVGFHDTEGRLTSDILSGGSAGNIPTVDRNSCLFFLGFFPGTFLYCNGMLNMV
jgi:hypothetical protein